MHVAEAKRVIGTSVNWLADTMDNVWHKAMGQTPNSELVIDPDGVIVARRAWSNPAELRADMERLVGAVEQPTRVEDLDLPAQPPAPTVAKGIVPRIEKPEIMWPIEVEALVEESKVPFYAKIRAEGDPGILADGNGQMYLAFHLDPLYRVHWNNEAGPVKFELTAPAGVTVTPASGVGPEVEAEADADPREFLIDVTAESVDEPLGLDVFYYACDDALTFCVPVNQSYRVKLARDQSHDWSIQTTADGPQPRGRPGGRSGGPGGGRGGGARGRAGPGGRGRPDFSSLDADGDGRISLDEAPRPMRDRFDRLDADSDGFVSESEFQRGPGGGGRRSGPGGPPEV